MTLFTTSLTYLRLTCLPSSTEPLFLVPIDLCVRMPVLLRDSKSFITWVSKPMSFPLIPVETNSFNLFSRVSSTGNLPGTSHSSKVPSRPLLPVSPIPPHTRFRTTGILLTAGVHRHWSEHPTLHPVSHLVSQSFVPRHFYYNPVRFLKPEVRYPFCFSVFRGSSPLLQ